MKRLIALSILCVGIAACDQPSEEGATVIRTGMTAGELPADFTLYPDAVTTFAAGNNSAVDSFVFESEASPETVLDHTRQEALAAGWEITTDIAADGDHLLIAEKEDGTMLTASAQVEGGATKGSLTFTPPSQ